MSKPYHTLPEALKGIVSQMGDNVIEDIKLVNILDDLYTLDDIPAAKNILRVMQSDGCFSEILASLSNSSWEVKYKMMVAKVTLQSGFKEDITQFIFDSIYYALGKIEKEPVFKTVVGGSSKQLVDLEIELKKLKGEFLTYIDDNVMVSDDSPAFFLANDKSDIFEYEEKINILNSALGKSDKSWCDERIKEVILKNSPTKPKAERKKNFFHRLFG